MTKPITKEMIIKVLHDFYRKHNKSPTNRDKLLYSKDLIINRFKSWNNALKAAKLPLNKNECLYVYCKECNKKIKKYYCLVRKNNFCSRSCSAKYSNYIRRLFSKKNIKSSDKKLNVCSL